MVFVDTDITRSNITTSTKQKVGLSEKELNKFETILTRQHRRAKSIRNNINKSFRNSSLDDSCLFNAVIAQNEGYSNSDPISLQRNSIAFDLNKSHENNNDFYENKLNEFINIKKKLTDRGNGIKKSAEASSSSSETNSLNIGSSSLSPSTNSLEKNDPSSTVNSDSSQLIRTNFDQITPPNLSNATLDNVLNLKNRSKLLSSLSSGLDEDDEEEGCIINDLLNDDDDRSSYSSRRETVIYKTNSIEPNNTNENSFTNSLFQFRNKADVNTLPVDAHTLPTDSTPGTDSVALKKLNITISVDNTPIAASSQEQKQPVASAMACEVASLSSMTSNYSQFDFFNTTTDKHRTPSPTKQDGLNNSKTNNSLTSFFFSNSLFKSNKKPPSIPESPKAHTNVDSASFSSNKFDILTSRLLNLKSNKKPPDNNFKPVMPYSLHSSTSSLANIPDTQSIRSDHSSHNLSSFFASGGSNTSGMSSSISADLKTMPNSVLIFENRPSNLPAKSQQEALKHKQEYERMVEAAKKKEIKENQLKFKKHEQQIKKEDFMTNSLRIWNTEILPDWHKQKTAKRTLQLWWHGLPPSIRGKVWKLAIGNELNLTKATYLIYKQKACDKLDALSRTSESLEKPHESSVELIKLDVSRTFPQLCFFQCDGPYHEALHSVLGAFACFNPQIGYVQGMSFLTAILLLNMDAPDAFICLANLLNMKYLQACFCMNQKKMNRYFRVHQILLEHNIPKLFKHFEEQKVKPDLYLIEWIFTLFSKSLPLDVMSRVWDVFFRDKEEFLFRTALGILTIYKEILLEMDFIHIVQFLTKLPENINSTHLFKAIESISTNIDGYFFTFENLIHQVVTSPSLSNDNLESLCVS